MSGGLVEPPEFAAFVRRILRAFVNRASDDPEALTLLAAVADDAADAVTEAARRCHAAGYSYAEIGSRLGCTKQAVHRRISRQASIDGGQA